MSVSGSSLKRGLNSPEKQRIFFDAILKTYGQGHLNSFYVLPSTVLEKTGADRFIKQYHGGSLLSALLSIYPEHIWDAHRFSNNQAVENPANLKDSSPLSIGPIRKPFPVKVQALQALKSHLRVSVPEDMYALSWERVSMAASGLSKELYASIESLLQPAAPIVSIQALASMIFPSFPFRPWNFRFVARSHWTSPQNRREFFDAFAKTREIDAHSMEKWYQIRLREIIQFGGNGILSVFGNSLPMALVDVYPDHHWQPWLFHLSGSESYKNHAAVRSFFETMRARKPLQSLYNVTRTAIRRRPHGRKLLTAFDESISTALSAAYPEHPWDKNRFASRKLTNTRFKSAESPAAPN